MSANKPSVSEWLQAKFESWRYQKGVKKTLTEFASFIGITEQRLLTFLDGSAQPKSDNLACLGAVLGFEIYDLVGISPSMILDSLPPVFRVRLSSAFTEYYETLSDKAYPVDSPEAQVILQEAAHKYKLTDVFTQKTC